MVILTRPALICLGFVILCLAISQTMFAGLNFEEKNRCPNEYQLLKLCDPKYRTCLESGADQCEEALSICTKSFNANESSDVCANRISSHMDSLKVAKPEFYEQLDQETFFDVLGGNKDKDPCNIYGNVVKIHKSFKDTTNYNRLLRNFPMLAATFCKCSEIDKSDHTGFREIMVEIPYPPQIWYGGLSTEECWKVLDQRIVLSYCGISSIEVINHIWAIHADCLETFNSSHCVPNFLQTLKNKTNLSSKKYTCRSYFDLIETFLEISENYQKDYEIAYLDNVTLPHLKSLIYKEDQLYLYPLNNEKDYLTCFNNKREVSSCINSWHHCIKNISTIVIREYPSDCHSNIVQCFNNTPNLDCKNKLVIEFGRLETTKKFWEFSKDWMGSTGIFTIIWYLLKAALIFIISFLFGYLLMRALIYVFRTLTIRLERKIEEQRKWEPLQPSNSPTPAATTVEVELKEIPSTSSGNNENPEENNNYNEPCSESSEVSEKDKKKEEGVQLGRPFHNFILMIQSALTFYRTLLKYYRQSAKEENVLINNAIPK